MTRHTTRCVQLTRTRYCPDHRTTDIKEIP